jgi:hypothetical protein
MRIRRGPSIPKTPYSKDSRARLDIALLINARTE